MYANEGVVRGARGGVRLQVADDRIRIAGRSIIWLNPLTPAAPAFRASWGRTDLLAASPGLPSRVPEALEASAVLWPYVATVFVYGVVGVPLALLFRGAAFALPVAAVTYLAIAALLVRLWFLRGSFGLSSRKFAVVAFECIACVPFAAGLVRRLSLAIPITEDLASFAADMPDELRARDVTELVRACDAMASFYSDEAAERVQLMRYREALAVLTLALGGAPTGVESASPVRRTVGEHPVEP